MKIKVNFGGQLRNIIGNDSVHFEVASTAKLMMLFNTIVQSASNEVRNLLLDEQGNCQPTILAFINNEQILTGENPILHEGSVVTLLTPMSGG